MRILLLLAAVGATLAAQGARPIVLAVDKDVRPEVAEALKKGAESALAFAGAAVSAITVADVQKAAGPGGLGDSMGSVVFARRERATTFLSAAAKAGVPVVDLGRTLGRAKPGLIDLEGPLAVEAASAAAWLFGPFAHHVVAPIDGGDPEDRDLVKAFAAEAKTRYPRKTVLGARRINGSKPEAVAKELAKEVDAGATAFFVAGDADLVRLVAEAARLMVPAPVVLGSSRALGYEAADAKDPAKPGMLPEGVVVLDADLPGPLTFKTYVSVSEMLAARDAGSPWTLLAFEAVLRLAGVAPPSGDGSPAAPGALRPRGAPSDPRGFAYAPIMSVKGAFVRCAPTEPDKPRVRPLLAGYDPEQGFGGFSRWSTLSFATQPDAVRCEFSFTDGKVRSIEQDLVKLKMSDGGRYPVVDHLVREKLLARVMSVTAEKFLLEKDGRPIPGKSFKISMVARRDKVKARLTWPCYVAGDDPAAGGRAFGSYCFIYSTFIERTIFEHFELLEEPFGPQDLATLTGVCEEEGPYITGTRRDVLYRLVENYAGSMGLTAAHEIGHLAGLGHDEDDPHGLMNVKEGAGIRHEDGHFTPTNEAALEKTLGRFPAATKPKQ